MSRSAVDTVPGILFLVATPIGNLEDLAPRAVRILQQVDLICAEDTRHSITLLQRFDIKTPAIALHDHNERERVPAVVARLCAGESIALISDAGTPLVSDPGFSLVRRAVEAGVEVVPIPGPSAVLAALVGSGLPVNAFTFVGFLPARQRARRDRLARLARRTETLVFYEAPHRLLDMLSDVVQVFGAERPACIARELTKLHESWWRGSAAELLDVLSRAPGRPRGEFVVVVQGAPESAATDALPEDVDRWLRLLVAELPPRRAAALAARITGQAAKPLYRRLLRLRSADDPSGG